VTSIPALIIVCDASGGPDLERYLDHASAIASSVTVALDRLDSIAHALLLHGSGDSERTIVIASYPALLSPPILALQSGLGVLDGRLAVRQPSSVLDAIPVSHDGRTVRAVGAGNLAPSAHMHSIDCFYGVAALGYRARQHLVETSRTDPANTLVQALDALAKRCSLGVWSISQLYPSSLPESGSHATTMIVTRFRKEARGRGAGKLRDEIAYLNRLPPDLRSRFPRVFGFDTGPTVWVEEELIPWPSLRSLVLAEVLTPSTLNGRLRSILRFCVTELYARDSRRPRVDHLDEYYLQRAFHRMRESSTESEWLRRIIEAPSIRIDGHEHVNAPALLAFVRDSPTLRAELAPDRVSSRGHGDLHFANILANPADAEAWRLIDPRGYPETDLAYDLGKLLHSVHGKYDLLHEGLFDLDLDVQSWPPRVALTLDPHGFATYERALQTTVDAISAVVGSEHWILPALFAEAIHFCSDAPFHLDGTTADLRAVAIYVTGVRLLNDYFARAEIPLPPIDPWHKRGQRFIGDARWGVGAHE
jgi:hypothetical protein